MTLALAAVPVLAALAVCTAYPTQQIYKQATSPGAFIGEGINSIGVALLQQDAEKQGNAAFSPLGHSAILAALAEGAAGKTRSQLLAALKLPQDSSLTRATYRSVLGRMKEKNSVNKPEFRSWFYVYKKSTKIEDGYATLLRDQYLMEVRDIDEEDEDTPTEFFSKKEEAKAKPEVAVEMQPAMDTMKPQQEAVQDTQTVIEPAKEPAKEDVLAIVPLPADTPSPLTPPDVPAVADSPKEDETKPAIVQDGAPTASLDVAEAPSAQVAVEQVINQEAVQDIVVPPQAAVEDVPAMVDAELPLDPAALPALPVQDAIKETVDAAAESAVPEATIAAQEAAVQAEPAEAIQASAPEIPASVTATVAKDEALKSEETKINEAEKAEAAVEESDNKLSAGATEHIKETLKEKISLAKFGKQGEIKDEKKPTGVTKGDKKKDEKKKGRSEDTNVPEESNDRQPSSGPSLLTAFNALYYKGTWQVPFDAKYRDDFLVGPGEKREVTTLRTQGSFRIGEIKELNATAIELPYKGENGRYSLLVLLPRAEDGLANLTAALSKFSFRYLGKAMREKLVDVAIPEFEIDCISHPQAVFKKLGMTSMLEKEVAEFPGISKNQRLYLQEDAMAQLVRFRVDDKNAIANYLSTMSMSTRSGLNVFHANRPFIFYLRDNLDNLTIVVGRVTDPSQRPAISVLGPEEGSTSTAHVEPPAPPTEAPAEEVPAEVPAEE